MKYATICLLLIITIFGACSTIKDSNSSIQQGVEGKVVWVEGNMMPSIGSENKSTSKPVERTLKIYETTHNSQVEGQTPLFTAVKSKLVATVKTNKDGTFKHQLQPGKYAIFTVEADGKLFASLGDGDGNIAPFEVKANEITKYDITINYRAAY